MSNLYNLDSSSVREFSAGSLASASKKEFEALEKLSIQSIRLQPGGFREPHIHPNAAQMDYCITGEAIVGIVGPKGQQQILELKAGDVSFVP